MNKSHLQELIIAYQKDNGEDEHTRQILDFLAAEEEEEEEEEEEDFWQSDNPKGHVTASAWVLDQKAGKVVLTHHQKLNRWFQLGGHIEKGDASIFEASRREVEEESGLQNLQLVDQSIFDIDVHWIPQSKKGFPSHQHFDIRILFLGDENESINFDKRESKEVAWLSFADALAKNDDESIQRMVDKSLQLTK